MMTHALHILLAVVGMIECQYILRGVEIHEGVSDILVLGEVEPHIDKSVATEHHNVEDQCYELLGCHIVWEVANHDTGANVSAVFDAFDLNAVRAMGWIALPWVWHRPRRCTCLRP